MKRIFSFTLWVIAALAIWYGAVSADLSSDISSLLWWSKSFWYSTSDKVEVKEIKSNSITFTSPIIKDWDGDNVEEYILLYGTKAFDVDNLSYFEEISIAPSDSELADKKFTVTLSTSEDSIDKEEIYHVVIIPKVWYLGDDDPDAIWDVSNEICFRLNDQKIWAWSDCSGISTNTSSNTSNTTDCANVNKILDVSCTWNGSTVTVSWAKMKEHLRISLFDESRNNWIIKKESIDANTNTNYSFTITQKTAPTIQLAATDNLCTPVNYTCHTLNTTTTTTTKTTVKPVVVWPKENIMAVIAWAVVLYLVYRVVRRKAN